MYNGIKSVATNAAILFGIEHVEANVQKKLEDLHFPVNAQNVIMEDI